VFWCKRGELLTAEERISFLRGEVEASTILLPCNWSARERSIWEKKEKEEEK